MAGLMARREGHTGGGIRAMVLVTVLMAAISSGIAGGGSSNNSGCSSSSSGNGVSKPPSSPNLCFASTSRGGPASLASSCSPRRMHATTTIGHCRRRRLPPPESGYYGVLSSRGPPNRTAAVSCSGSGEAGTSTTAAAAATAATAAAAVAAATAAAAAAAAAAAEGSGTLEEEGATSPALAVQGVPIEGGGDGCVDSGGDAAVAGVGTSRNSKGFGMLARSMAATERFFARHRSSRAGETGGQWRRRPRRRRRGVNQEGPAVELGGGVKEGGEGAGEDGLRVPRHVAFVMDGNGRWAAGKNMPRRFGHVEGALRAREAVEACRELGVEFVTLYAFSTENWSRPSAEVSFLMELMEKTLAEERESLRRNGIRLVAIGELHRLPTRLRRILEEIEDDSCAADSVGARGGEGGALAVAPPLGVGGGGGGGGVAPNGGFSVDVPVAVGAVAVEPAPVRAPAGVASAGDGGDGGDDGGPFRPSGSGSAEVDVPGGGGGIGAAVSAEQGASERGGAMTPELQHQQQHQARATTTSKTNSTATKLTATPANPSIATTKPTATTTKPAISNTTTQQSTTTATETTKPTTMTLCLAVSYGGRAEVAAAARELAADAAAGRLDPADIDEAALARRLSTARLGIPDPDLVVRTSGESRLSNLLLWQAAYAELCVISKAWPEFHRPDLVETFRDFGRRRRRHGKTPEQVAEALDNNMEPQP